MDGVLCASAEGKRKTETGTPPLPSPADDVESTSEKLDSY